MSICMLILVSKMFSMISCLTDEDDFEWIILFGARILMHKWVKMHFKEASLFRWFILQWKWPKFRCREAKCYQNKRDFAWKIRYLDWRGYLGKHTFVLRYEPISGSQWLVTQKQVLEWTIYLFSGNNVSYRDPKYVKPSCTMQKYLKYFFNFYGNIYKTKDHVISPHQGGLVGRGVEKDNGKPHPPIPSLYGLAGFMHYSGSKQLWVEANMCVQDIFVQNSNITYNIKAADVESFQTHCLDSEMILLQNRIAFHGWRLFFFFFYIFLFES